MHEHMLIKTCTYLITICSLQVLLHTYCYFLLWLIMMTLSFRYSELNNFFNIECMRCIIISTLNQLLGPYCNIKWYDILLYDSNTLYSESVWSITMPYGATACQYTASQCCNSLCCVLFCPAYVTRNKEINVMRLSIYFMIFSLSLWKYFHCSGASEATLMN